MLRILSWKIRGPDKRSSSASNPALPVRRAVFTFGLAGVLIGSIGSLDQVPDIRCSCLAPEDLNAAVSSADLVFVGTAVSSRMASDTVSLDDEDGTEIVLPTRIVGFRVWGGWKGTMDSHIEIRTGTSAADCGFPFEEGATYLVFARAEGSAISTGICSRTAAVADALSDLAQLGSPAFTPERG